MAGPKKAGRRALRKVPGRRKGRPSSRGAVLEAARVRFARDGYDATTIRGVAADAGVDPALVMQFYGSKEGLFAAILDQAASISEPLLEVLADRRRGRGVRFARAYLALWEDPITGDKLRSLLRAAIGSPRATRMFQGHVQAVLTRAGVPAAQRIPYLLAASHLLGVAIARYVIELPELVEPSVNELVRRIGPAIERYLGMPDKRVQVRATAR